MVSARLTSWRRSRGLSLRKAASVLGVSHSTLLALERGQRSLTTTTARKIAPALGLRDWRLLFEAHPHEEE